ncbi:MAG TPA: hypothetical protein DCZ97_01025 [Syntrophus sp. (in: bacteria)]|nr:hypothetical protein [Syntrophus sp. (in: bacteria)]
MIKETGATPLTLLSSAEVWDRIDPLAPDLGTDPVVMGLGALPYAQLSCPQFERLCYELLVAEGFSPRFFGRRGQRDYGVDIIVESGEKRRVYQCKNFAHEPKSAELRDAVAKFEADWLIGANLPRPQQFVYCCPQPLNDKALGESWTKFKDDFQQRTKVEVSFWDKYALDARLRRLPDIVAGLFSDSYAEHFCMCDDWRDDLWIRVSWNEARHPSIERFLNWHKRGAIYVSDEDEQHFQDLLSASPVLAIRGLPGSGKTFFGLEMGCRLYEPRRRLYYATLKDSTNPDRLWKSVRRRGNLPSLFVLDDCHLDLNCAGIVRERLVPELKGGAVKLLFILRDPPVSAIHEFDDTPDWLISLEQDEALIDMRTSLNRTRTVVEHLRTDMVGLSQLRLGKLHHFSGGDLLLLDELLSGIHSPLELDELRPEKLYHQIRSRYFEGNRILPTIRILASLAQFDLTPLASFLDGGWQSGEKALAAPLMSELFGPPRYQFLHSSLAELVLRAQAALEIDTAHLEQDVAKTTAGALLTYLHHLLLSSAARDGREVVFMANLELVLTGRLKLAEGSVEAGIKASVLADEAIQAGVEAHLNHCSFNFLNICLINLSIAAHPALRRYLELVENRFRLLFQHHHDGFDSIGLKTVGTGFLSLRRNAPDVLARMEEEFGSENLLCLIVANGNLFELFRILQYATSAFREALMDRLDPGRATALVEKTITARRSVGTLHFTIRELSKTDPALLGRLEQAIGAQQFLRLIAANGTLFELFRIMEYATPAFREALMDRLDPDGAAALVDKTIAAGRSVGTLPLAMRELSETDPALLGRLEQAIGAQQFLRLIAANGTLIDLFGILERATSAFRKALVDRLDPDGATVLVDKTIAAGRSIESLHHTLRQLSKIPAQLERLEDLIGVHGWWRLFVGVGTLNSISQNTQVMSDVFRERIINASSDLGVPEWQGIIARGLFLNACTFVTDKLATYPAASRTAFCEALRQAAGPLAAEASWFDINPSHPPASPDSDESRILHEALRMRVEGINMDGFFGLDFREATNALAFAWRKRIDLRPSLASHFLEILPPTTEWPRQEGVIAAIRLVLAIARSEAIPLQDAQQLLATTGLFLDQDVCAETHTLPLFLLIWNMVALHYERVTNHSFDGALPNKLVETLLDQLEQRVRSKGPNKEKIAQLALAGLLGFLLPSVTAKLRNIIKPFSGTTPWLEEEINKDQVGFVPALFALEGIALLKQSDAVFKPLVCAKILLKLGKYEDIGPAIEHLRERVKRHGKRR